jgi:transcription elongation factor Elf1
MVQVNVFRMGGNFMMTEQVDDKMVKCQRCNGLLVRDSIFNLEGQFHRLEVLRCLNCGETIDMTILKAREGKNDRRGKKEFQLSSSHVN